jgi:hypothetical protein
LDDPAEANGQKQRRAVPFEPELLASGAFDEVHVKQENAHL